MIRDGEGTPSIASETRHGDTVRSDRMTVRDRMEG